MKKKIILITGALLLSLFGNMLYAQATLTITQYYISGRNCGGYSNILPYMQGQTFQFPSLSECKQAKQQIDAAFAKVSSQIAGTGCTIVFNCNCSGSDPTSSTAGGINPNGTSQGSAYFSNNPAEATTDWMKDVNTQKQALGNRGTEKQTNYNPSDVNIPAAGYPAHDKAYTTVVFDYYKGNRIEIRNAGDWLHRGKILLNSNSYINKPYIQRNSYDILKEQAASMGININDYPLAELNKCIF